MSWAALMTLLTSVVDWIRGATTKPAPPPAPPPEPLGFADVDREIDEKLRGEDPRP